MKALKICLTLVLMGLLLSGCKEKHKIEVVPDLNTIYYSQGQVDVPVNLSPDADKLQKNDILNSIKPIVVSKPKTPVTYSLNIGIYINEKGTIDKIKDLGSKIFFNDSLEEMNRQETINKLMDAIAEGMANWKFTPAMENGKPVKSRSELDFTYTANPDGSNVNDLANYDVSAPGMNDFFLVDKNPQVETPAIPQFPELAKQAGVEGTVYVKVLVNKKGIPTKAVVIKSDNEVFNQPSIDAAMKFKFTPAIKDDKPIAVWVVLPFRYRLGGSPKGSVMKYRELQKMKPNKDKINNQKQEPNR